MKRLLLIGVLFMLLVVGWSGVLAAALCSHPEDTSPVIAEGHACCRVETAQQADAHCPASPHEAMGDMEMTPLILTAARHTDAHGPEPLASCPHCVGKSGLPITPVLAANSADQSKRDTGAAVSHVFKPLVPRGAAFTPPVTARQGAPPGASVRRHVLLSVFLI